MTFGSSKSNGQGLWRVLLALVCIALVLASGTIQAVHTHANGDATHADCSLCATAHVAAQVTTPALALFVTPLVSRVEAVAAPLRLKSFSTFALFTRPPPVDVFSA